jgi:hypothetical protein
MAPPQAHLGAIFAEGLCGSACAVQDKTPGTIATQLGVQWVIRADAGICKESLRLLSGLQDAIAVEGHLQPGKTNMEGSRGLSGVPSSRSLLMMEYSWHHAEVVCYMSRAS